MKKSNIILLVVGLVVLVGLGWYFYSQWGLSNNVTVTPLATSTPAVKPTTTTPAVVPGDGGQSFIGKTIEGRDITAYHFGTGETKVLFVAGIHGGYEWNTSVLAYELMDYLEANPTVIPKNVQVTVIAVLNPDGLFKVVDNAGQFTAADVNKSQAVQISGRYNANTVDLNRNFDCDWQTTGKWQSTTVSGGKAVFSEPESRAFKNYVEALKPAGVVVFFSSAGGVYSSSCGLGILPETTALTNLYAKASGYPAYKSFDAYATTGDMVNWLAKIKIPAISVLLTNHTGTELSKNQAGIKAVLQYYAK